MPIHSEMRDQFPPTGPTSASVFASSGPADQEECTMVFVGLLLGRFGQLWASVSSPPGKLCPHCAEKLKAEATTSRFCSAALAAN